MLTLPTVNSKLKLLRALISASSTSIVHIHCFGIPGTGVLETLRGVEELLHSEDIAFQSINCLEVEGDSRYLLSRVASSFKLLGENSNENVGSVEQLSKLLGNHFDGSVNRRLVLVLVGVDALMSSLPPSFLTAFFDVSRTNDCGGLRIVTTSNLSWPRLSSSQTEGSLPFQIQFQMPSTAECSQWIANELNAPRLFVENCIHHLAPFTNDPSTLRAMIGRAWQKHEACEQSASSMKATFDSLDIETRKSWSLLERREEEWALSPSARLLLIAAFFASHNSPDSDKRYFIKCHGREKSRDQRTQRPNAAKAGKVARVFALERLLFLREALLALYPEVAEQCRIPSHIVMLQVRTLESLSLLCSVSAAGNLTSPRFKCTADYEIARRFARELGVDLNVHLDIS